MADQRIPSRIHKLRSHRKVIGTSQRMEYASYKPCNSAACCAADACSRKQSNGLFPAEVNKKISQCALARAGPCQCAAQYETSDTCLRCGGEVVRQADAAQHGSRW